MRYTKFSELEGEIYISIEAPCGLTFTQSLDNVKKAYSELLGSHALSGNTEVAVRYYLSDITNQADELRRDIADTHQQSFVSIIGQPPASGAKVILCAYHIAARSLSKTLMAGLSRCSMAHTPPFGMPPVPMIPALQATRPTKLLTNSTACWRKTLQT